VECSLVVNVMMTLLLADVSGATLRQDTVQMAIIRALCGR
jgi:hypothetical protein